MDLFSQAKAPSIARLVEDFLRYLETERAASRHTIVNYGIDLRRWVAFLTEATGGRASLEDCASLKLVRDFLSAESSHYERVTVARRLSVLKSFLLFLHREGYLTQNVAKLVSLPKVPHKLPHVLKVQEAVRLIESVPANNLKNKRIRAILELFYSTGIRLSELVALNHGHIDLGAGTARVLGKGGQERVVPLGRHCQSAIRDYIDSLPATQRRGQETPLFLNRDGGRISARSVQRDLRAYAVEILGTSGLKVSPHTFRHSCATHLLGAGAGLREIQELLGHRSLVTTQKYTQVDIEKLKASYQRAHPRAKGEKATGRKREKETETE